MADVLQLWLGVAVLVYGIVVGVRAGFQAITAKFPPTRWERACDVMVACYPIGLGCKIAQLGPEVVRFHLADIGFPVFIGSILLGYFWKGYVRRNAEDLDNWDWSMIDLGYTRYYVRFLFLSLIVSYAYEGFSGFFWAMQPGAKVELVGSFDWWDMASYTLGFVIVLGMIIRWRWYSLSALQHSQRA